MKKLFLASLFKDVSEMFGMKGINRTLLEGCLWEQVLLYVA